jgi:hypothetical protein
LRSIADPRKAETSAKEQPFCRLLAGRDLGESTCANSPELAALLAIRSHRRKAKVWYSN